MNMDVDFGNLKPFEVVDCPKCPGKAIVMMVLDDKKSLVCPHCQHKETLPADT